MSWDEIRVFLAAARAKQFLAAARELQIDHATVSRKISALEKRLGTRLFNRQTTGSVLTPAGERLLEAAEQVESFLLLAQADITKTDVELSGTVRIGAPDGFGTKFLCPLLGKLKQRHPGLTIQIVPLSRTFSLSKRDADIAIMIDRPNEGRLSFKKLIDYTLHYYASETYFAQHGAPDTLDALQEHDIVTYVYDLLFAEQLNFMPELFSSAYTRIECSNAMGQIEAVRGGAGIGILHDYLAYQDDSLKVVLPQHSFERSYWIVTHQDMKDLGRVRAVSDFIVAEVGLQKKLFRTQT